MPKLSGVSLLCVIFRQSERAMEKPDAQAYRKGVIKGLKVLDKKDRPTFLSLVQKTSRYAEARQMNEAERVDRRAKTDSVEQQRSAEQIAAEIIEMLKTNPHMEFLAFGIGNLRHVKGGGGLTCVIASGETGGLLENKRPTE